MASSTDNLSLIKPDGTDKIRIAQINQNMDTIDAKIGAVGATSLQAQNIAQDQAMAIVATGNTHGAISSGQFVYVRNHGTLSEGLYTADSAIAANVTLSSSNLTAVSGGGLNSLKSNISSLSSQITGVNLGTLANLSALESALDTLGSSITVRDSRTVWVQFSANASPFSSTGYSGTFYKVFDGRYRVVFWMNANNYTIEGAKTASGWIWDSLALGSQITNKTYSMKSGTSAYGVLMRSGNVVFFTVFNTSWNSTASTSIISDDSNAVTLSVPSGYRPAYNVEIKEALNDKRITVATNGAVTSNTSYTGINLRFSACWITGDAMPT